MAKKPIEWGNYCIEKLPRPPTPPPIRDPISPLDVLGAGSPLKFKPGIGIPLSPFK
jgi:hypothetical protein